MLVSWTKACLISLLDVWAEQSMSPAFQIRLGRRLTKKNWSNTILFSIFQKKGSYDNAVWIQVFS